MRVTKRCIAAFSLIFCMMLSILAPASAAAAELDNCCGENLTWSVEDGRLLIRGSGDMYSYGSGKAPWYSQASSITAVEVCSGVTSVSGFAFYKCTALKEAVLADSVIELDSGLFYGCTSLASVKLPSHLTVIPYEAFLNCKALPQITLPNSITTIGTDAFENCASLTSIEIPDSVNSVGQYAFYGCRNLQTATIGIGLNSIGYDVFAGCEKLHTVNVSANNPHLSSLDGVVYSKEQDVLMFRPAANGTSITIPATVQVIRSKAFVENNTGVIRDSILKNVYFEGNMPSFASDCFFGITAAAYYPRNNSSWNPSSLEGFGGNITWLPYDYETRLIPMEQCQIKLAYETAPWTGNPCYPEVTVSYQGSSLIEGIHFAVAYDNNKNIGTASVTVSGLGSYSGSVVRCFTITKGVQTLDLSITGSTIEVGNSAKITAIGTRGLLYITYSSDHPEIASVNQNGQVTGVAAGTAVIEVTSAGNETYLPISRTLMVTVIPAAEGLYDINQCQISMVTGNQSYTGSPMEAIFNVRRGNIYLIQNKDYKVTCSNCTEAGTATAVVTGINDYIGSAAFSYEILPAGQSVRSSISPETILVGQTARITAEGIGAISYHSDTPDIATVDQNGLVRGIAVGTAMIETRAAGDRNHHAASHYVRLKVEAALLPELIPISDCSITLKTTDYVYDGSAKCPQAQVSYQGKTLVEGRDYTMSYHNNVNAGYPAATVVGIGEYTGSAGPFSYRISSAPQNVRISTLSPLVIKVGESAQIAASGIGRLTYFTATANNSLEIGQDTGIVTGLAPGSVEVIVLASGDSNHLSGNARISVQVKAKEPVSLQTPVLDSVSNTAAGVKVVWKPVAGAAKYRVYHKTGTSGWTRLADTTALSYTDTAVSSGTKYTYTVRCLSADSKSFTSGYDAVGKSITYIAAPKLTKVTNTITGITIAWNKSAGAVKYRVYRKTGGGSWTRLADTTALSYSDKTAVSGTTYLYTVRCVNAAANAFTSSYDAAGLKIIRLSVPAPKSAVNSAAGKVTVSWSPVTGAGGYYVYRKTGTSSWSKIGTVTGRNTTSFVDTAVVKGKTYTYTMRAYYGTTMSDFNGNGVSVKITR